MSPVMVHVDTVNDGRQEANEGFPCFFQNRLVYEPQLRDQTTTGKKKGEILITMQCQLIFWHLYVDTDLQHCARYKAKPGKRRGDNVLLTPK